MAHVMNYFELKTSKMGDGVYEEVRTGGLRRVYHLVFNGHDFTTKGLPWLLADHYLTLSECDEDECFDYNWNYRVWDKEPTEEEMNNTPWRENPYE